MSDLRIHIRFLKWHWQVSKDWKKWEWKYNPYHENLNHGLFAVYDFKPFHNFD